MADIDDVVSSRGSRDPVGHMWIKARFGRQQGGIFPRYIPMPLTRCPLTLADPDLAGSDETCIFPMVSKGFGVGWLWEPVRASARTANFHAILPKNPQSGKRPSDTPYGSL